MHMDNSSIIIKYSKNLKKNLRLCQYFLLITKELKVSEIRSPALSHYNKTSVSLLSPKPLNALVLNQK